MLPNFVVLFIIQSINLFFVHNFILRNLKFKHLIEDMTINV